VIPNPSFALRLVRYSVSCLFLLSGFSLTALASPAEVHGLWLWKSPTVLEAPNASESLLEFCKSENITEIYVSISERSEAAEESHLVHLISSLHRSNIRVEALLSSSEADEPGKHRETLLRHVQGVLQFNQRHPSARFDGIHLDIEPQQRPENKGAGNLRFLPGLADAFREVRALTDPAGLTLNADIQNKLLKGDLAQRKMLLSAVPRVTLMMYELSSPGDGESPEQKAEKVASNSRKYLNMAYDGLPDGNLARMAIALRTPDYGELLSQMLKKVDEANRSNPHYIGWARHSYNDHLRTPN
jgi:hypothetical protein